MKRIVLLFVFFIPATAEAASTAAARGAQPSRAAGPVFGAPLRLQFLIDHRGGPRAQLGFSMRWNVDDIPKVPRNVARLAFDPVTTAERAARETLTDAHIGAYAMQLNASDILPLGLLLRPFAFASSYLGTGSIYDRAVGVAPLAAPAGGEARNDNRYRLSLTPVVDEIRKNWRRELRRGIITSGFDLALPAGHKFSYGQQETLLNEMRRTGRVWGEEFD